ncbi:hypothetical protein GLAREA_00688 [Glarea lozoyensis ATCC 20868]|uniref:Uncharacterized protein n=1 Tax=Glarea lozoyensis (strain ATCC 20868 / MF5171) TaxID=1116229 RepID=S3DSW5_GLAL2|nr:uncharacterized protein GLAREA_00688 [Glarea lozoyensis ATCC 20868]EPE29528.1 hypothetical protein GLAREA_00688 [Glarea lozoyensis ATCC 20868]
MNLGNWETSGLGYATVESLLEDVSNQMAMSNLSRLSRPSSTYSQRTSGSMRVVKPSSASNSPRGSMGAGKRRTVVSDGPYRRKATFNDQHTATSMSAGFVSNEALQVPARTNRPVSWHPSSQQPPQVPSQSFYPPTTYNYSHQQYQYPSYTPEVYSSYNSPSMNYGPATVPLSSYEQQYLQGNSGAYFQNSYLFSQQPMSTEERPSQYTPQPEPSLESMVYSQHDWDSFSASNFQSTTAPPTPENFLPIQHPEPAMESIPYQPLSDDEDSGEELLGLGLYDTPKSPEADPQLDNYKSLLMNTFVGHPYQGPEVLPSNGKGLKLEEGWTPPSDDGEEDGEGSDEDDDTAPVAVASHDHQNYGGNWV